MTQASITITSDVVTLRRVLDLLAAEQPAQIDSAEWRPEGIRRFIASLNPSCREVVTMIVANSANGQLTSRTQLIAGSSTATDDGQLTGIIGTIGRRWHEALPDRDNPFMGRRIAPDPDVLYAVDRELAGVLLNELESDANRWRAGLPSATSSQPRQA